MCHRRVRYLLYKYHFVNLGLSAVGFRRYQVHHPDDIVFFSTISRPARHVRFVIFVRRRTEGGEDKKVRFSVGFCTFPPELSIIVFYFNFIAFITSTDVGDSPCSAVRAPKYRRLWVSRRRMIIYVTITGLGHWSQRVFHNCHYPYWTLTGYRVVSFSVRSYLRSWIAGVMTSSWRSKNQSF